MRIIMVLMMVLVVIMRMIMEVAYSKAEWKDEGEHLNQKPVEVGTRRELEFNFNSISIVI